MTQENTLSLLKYKQRIKAALWEELRYALTNNPNLDLVEWVETYTDSEYFETVDAVLPTYTCDFLDLAHDSHDIVNWELEYSPALSTPIAHIQAAVYEWTLEYVNKILYKWLESPPPVPPSNFRAFEELDYILMLAGYYNKYSHLTPETARRGARYRIVGYIREGKAREALKWAKALTVYSAWISKA